MEALGSGSAASRLTDPSAAARVQRKRLFLLFKCASCCPCAAAVLLRNLLAAGACTAGSNADLFCVLTTHSSVALCWTAGVHWASCGGARQAASFPCSSSPPPCCWLWHGPERPSSGSKPAQHLRLGGTGGAAAAAAKAPAATAALPCLHDHSTCMSTTEFHQCMTVDTFDAAPIPPVERIAQFHRLFHRGRKHDQSQTPLVSSGNTPTWGQGRAGTSLAHHWLPQGACQPCVMHILLSMSSGCECVGIWVCGSADNSAAGCGQRASPTARHAGAVASICLCSTQSGTLVAAVSRLFAALRCTLCPESARRCNPHTCPCLASQGLAAP